MKKILLTWISVSLIIFTMTYLLGAFVEGSFYLGHDARQAVATIVGVISGMSLLGITMYNTIPDDAGSPRYY